MNFFLRLSVLWALILTARSESLEGTTKLILNSVALRYADLSRWKAKFTQEISNPALGSNSFNEGEFFFQAPSQFRFSILGNDGSDFVCDGKQAWHVVFRKGREKAGFVKHFTNIAQLDLDRYLILLRGFQIKNKKQEQDFLKKFNASGSQEGDILKLKLTPKKSSEIVQIEMLTKNSEKIPYEMNLTDALGVVTKIRITSWEKLKTIPVQTFVPSIPKGSEVESYQ